MNTQSRSARFQFDSVDRQKLLKSVALALGGLVLTWGTQYATQIEDGTALAVAFPVVLNLLRKWLANNQPTEPRESVPC